MTLWVYVGAVDVTNSIRYEDGIQTVTSSADGVSAGTCTIKIDDPTGSMSFSQWAAVRVVETASSQPRTHTGWVYKVSIDRGPYRTGAGRVWVLDVGDLNVLTHWRALRASDAKRPQETGSARIAWLLSSVALSGLVYDNGAVAANSWLYDEADYRDSYGDDVLSSIVSASGELGRVFFVYWDPIALQPSLFYASPNAVLNVSSLQLSNVLSDVDETTTFWTYESASLEGAGDDVYDGVSLSGPFGRLYRQLATTYATTGVHRDAVVEDARFLSAAQGSLHADNFLAKHAAEVQTITCMARLPAAKVNLIDVGMRIKVRFQHLPGWDTAGGTWTRVALRTLAFTPGTNDYYDLQLTLTTAAYNQNGGGGAGLPLPPPTVISVVQFIGAVADGSHSVTLPATPTVGNTLVAFPTARGSGVDMPTGLGWTEHSHGSITPSADTAKMYYRPVISTDTAAVKVAQTTAGWSALWEITGVVTPISQSNADIDTATQPASVNAGTVTPTAGQAALILTGICVHCSDWGGNGDTTIATDAAFTLDGKDEVVGAGDLHPLTWAGHRSVTSASGTYGPTNALTGAGFNFGGWGGLQFAFSGTAAVANPPLPGQWVFDEVPTPAPDGSTVTFTLLWPYADGSLTVYVDHYNQTAGVTTFNGAAGTFTASWVAKAGQLIQVKYQGR